MTDPDNPVNVDELRARLPDMWRVENNGAGVYGYADNHAPMRVEAKGEIPACFSIQPAEDHWAATWKDRHELGDELDVVSDRVTGVRERCIAWVTEKACGIEGYVRR